MLAMVTINGSPTPASRTGVLLSAVSREIEKRLEISSQSIDLASDGPDVMQGLLRTDASERGEHLLRLAEAADLLVVGSPIYRASYTGVLKHFFDLVDRDAIRGKKVILCATGASHLHGLALEHQMRPLFGFFYAHTAPTTLYGVPADFADGRIVSSPLQSDIKQAVEEVVTLFGGEHVEEAETISA